MKKLTIVATLVFGLVVSANSAFAVSIQFADIFVTPSGDPSILGGFCGGDGTGTGSNDDIDWCIGNKVPRSSTETDDMVFSTNIGDFNVDADWVERMRITKDGSVGVGTTAPAAKLHVEGQIKI